MDVSTHHLPHDRPSRILWLLVGISGLCGLGWLINSMSPNNLGALLLFFGILFITVYGLAFFITHTGRRAFLLAFGVLLFFLLRFLGLREWYYPILLIACLVSLEILFQKR